ncbi:hypothetical protein C2R22_09320 [Salinigranum rubrum]|uniref:Uncharacterized protein n=1 Tax=Salinigranum rubrum TaxID=755307 RepID=A0A2I8VIR2_9EURY|nr:hypothetical protein [Salinigranum rubrum]AUV81822.1 hypothetical protein C2R22_09320 [Salinigranum rubrum]
MDSAEYERLSELFERDEILYVGFRIIYNANEDRPVSGAERDEIPFYDSRLFPVFLLSYLALRRIWYLVQSRLGSAIEPFPADSHLFTLSTDQGYRTYSFRQVGQQLREQGTDIVYLTSPSVSDVGAELSADGFRVVSHRELFGLVPLGALPRLFLRTRARMKTLETELSGSFEVSRPQSTVARNVLLTEAVKTTYLGRVADEHCTVHTYSPMPYLTNTRAEERVLVYQHGMLLPDQWELAWAIPFFRPLTYLVWGPAWKTSYEAYAHPEAPIEAVGSPWLDHLAERSADSAEPEYDVLLVSNARRCATPEDHDLYERFVRHVVETCEANGWSLAVKLHPDEATEWYDSRGWGSFVVPFEDITDGILASKLTVTNGSSAFIESCALGRPVVVTDLFGVGLGHLQDRSGLHVSALEDIPADLRTAMETDSPRAHIDGLVDLGGSTERIVEYVRDRDVSDRRMKFA